MIAQVISNVLLGQAAPSGGLSSFLPIILIAAFFLLLTLPQRRMKKQQALLQDSLAVGDRVRTAGGVHGNITEIDTNTVIVEVESGRMKVDRRAVVAKLDT